MLHIHHLSLFHLEDQRVLLDDLTCHLHAGECAVLIGEEGNGKSTLLRLIAASAGVVPAPDYVQVDGRIETDSSLIAYLPQSPAPDDLKLSVYDYMLGGPAPDPWGGRPWPVIAGELGIDPDLLFSPRPLGSLSGGEKIKVQMARLMLQAPDIWLLDEPSNDLDLETLEWLEQFLLARRELVVLISHDEVLIRRCADVIIHLERIRRQTRSRFTVTRLPYDAYLEARDRQFTKQDRLAKMEEAEYRARRERFDRIRQRVEHEQATVSPADPASGRLLKKKMQSVQSLGKRIEKQYADRTRRHDEEAAILAFFDDAITVAQGKILLDLHLPTLTTRDGSRVLARDLDLTLSGPEKVAIIGPNGSGKTTLLRHIAETLLARDDLRVGYMPQDYAERMSPTDDILSFLVPSGHYALRQKARDHLGAMRFTSDEMLRPLGELSGGQKAKLFLLRMILHRAEVLVLDEPTRNFSPLSGGVIREILKDYGGAMLAVSHDRSFLAAVPDRILELTPDGLVRSDRDPGADEAWPAGVAGDDPGRMFGDPAGPWDDREA